MDFQTHSHHFRNHHFQTCSDIQRNPLLYLGCPRMVKSQFLTNNFDTLAISANGWYEGIYDLLFDLNLWFDPTLGNVDLTLAFVLIKIDVPGKAKLKILSEPCLKTFLLSGAKACYSNYHLLTYQVISKSAWKHAFLQKSVFSLLSTDFIFCGGKCRLNLISKDLLSDFYN